LRLPRWSFRRQLPISKRRTWVQDCERYKLRVGQSLQELVAILYAVVEAKWMREVLCVLL
jgi:hypothetical protein